MPANLPPQYFEAEKQYRRARDPEEKIAALQVMLAIMPKHKGTDKLHGELRRRIAKLTEELERGYAAGRRGDRYYVRKEGAGQAVLVGLPNVGKSQLLAAVTGALSEVANYPFTTKVPIPGMMKFENIQIQIVDVPPITSKDANPWLGNLFRNADILIVVIDLTGDPRSQVVTITEELARQRVRLVGLDCEVETGPGEYVKRALIVGNKRDISGDDKYAELHSLCGGQFQVIGVSAGYGDGMEDFKVQVFRCLNIVRVYTKAPGGKPDLEDPVILRKGSTVEAAAESVHKDFRAKLKYALVWGSGKYDGQRVRRDHVMKDGDVVELHI